MGVFIQIIVYLAAAYLALCLIYFFIQERVIFIPFAYNRNFNYKLAVPFDEVFIDTPHGGSINALIIKHREPRGIMLYLHGNTGSLNRWSLMAEELTHLGYAVLAIDYRGYGKSKGKRSEEIMHSDVLAVWQYMEQKFPNLPHLIYGRSLGSGLAVRLATRVQAEKMVLETPYYSLLHVAQHYFPFLPMKLLLRYTFRSDKYIRQVPCPTLILHGTRDRIVPYDSALRLYQKAEDLEHIAMVTIVGGRHNNLNAYPLFRDKLLEFLQ